MIEVASSGSVAPALERQHMPCDYRISQDRYIGREGIGGGYAPGEKRIPKDFGPEQSLRGFDPVYRNIIDYIVRITHRIWEERDVAYIGDTYTTDSQVFDDYGLQSGNRKIIEDTRHTIAAFTNIRLIADEIVWAGNDEVGFHTSHRTLIRGTNDGDSKYGPATGKKVDVLVIANCVSRNNRIFLEHVLYNNSSLVLQLGLDLREMAERMSVLAPAGWPRTSDTWRRLRETTRPVTALSVAEPIDGFDVDAFSRTCFDALWNRRDYEILHEKYLPGFEFLGPTNRAFSGRRSYRDFLQRMASDFPDLILQIDEVYWMGNEWDGFLTSVRWSASGTHAGNRQFGPATGANVQVWGITQQRIRGGRVEAEWMLFNELDLMMQISAARRQKGGN
jgi:predicted ester cyclase